ERPVPSHIAIGWGRLLCPRRQGDAEDQAETNPPYRSADCARHPIPPLSVTIPSYPSPIRLAPHTLYHGIVTKQQPYRTQVSHGKCRSTTVPLIGGVPVCAINVRVESVAWSGLARWVLESSAVRVSEWHPIPHTLLCQAAREGLHTVLGRSAVPLPQ